jgi:serine/threonine-protein kinase
MVPAADETPRMVDPAHWQRVSACLDQALDLDPEARASWLLRLSGIEPQLAEQLAALLAAHDAALAEAFLEGVPTLPVPTAALRGRRLGAYTLHEPIGQGGMGSVWRALRSDGQYQAAVAIKLLNTALIGAAGLARFKREGSVLARLQHPHIAHLLDAGVSDDGQPYLVLELVEGEPIDVYCTRLRLGVEQRLGLFLDTLAAVEHAHTHLVVHRDLKPSNVLVMDGGQVKLLDFGIAKLLEDGGGDGLTQEGTRALTPQYAAPEQLQGGAITTATDVYALGVMLYQLLGGRHPTGGDHGSAAQIIRATLDTEPARLSDLAPSAPGATGADLERIAADRATSVAGLRRQLRGDLDNIVARALSKPPAERYPSVAALADDLRRYLAHEPVAARPASLAYRSAKFVRRHRAMVLAGLLLLLAVAGGTVGIATQARRAEAQALLARSERDRAQRELANSEAVEEFMTFLLSSSADKPFTVSELLSRGEALARQQFAGDATLRARLQLSLAGLTSELDEQDRTMALLREARSAAAGSDDVPLQAAIECAIAADLAGEPDAAKAAAMFDAALKRVVGGTDSERATRAACLNQRATRELEMGAVQDALRDSRAALQALGRPRPGQRSLALAMRVGLAGALAKSGDLAAGIGELKAVIGEVNALGRGKTVGAATFHNNLAVLLWRSGDPLGALAAVERALAIPGDSETINPGTLWMHRARHLLAVGREQEAIEVYERARTLSAQQGDVRGLAYGTVGFEHCPTGEAARCDQRLAEARSILAGFLPPGHVTFANLDTTVGTLALARGDLTVARAAFLDALEVFDKAPVLQPMRTRAAALLARTELALGRPDAAAARAAEAVAQARTLAKGFEHSEWLGSALLAQAIVQQRRGEAAAAQASARAALAELQPTVGDAAPTTVEARRLLAAF